MINPDIIRKNPEILKENIRRREINFDVEKLIELDNNNSSLPKHSSSKHPR
jgi:seryl-tRNA synthetase